MHKKNTQTSLLRVSVGIPAYNEGRNIKALITQVLTQERSSYELVEVIIVSDGSEDNTDQEVLSINDPRIRLVNDGVRKGKVARQNELFDLFQGDVLVSFDADITLPRTGVLEDMVKPFLNSSPADLVCGVHWPLAPGTLIGKLAYFGADYWETVKNLLGANGDMYNCLGQVRAFSRLLAKEMRIPEEVGTFEDTYSFLFAKMNHFKVIVVHTAQVQFRLPSNLQDYVRQMSRYIQVKDGAEHFFTKDEVARFHHVTTRVKLKAFTITVKKYSVAIAFGYVILQLFTFVYGAIVRQPSVWNISPSTKLS